MWSMHLWPSTIPTWNRILGLFSCLKYLLCHSNFSLCWSENSKKYSFKNLWKVFLCLLRVRFKMLLLKYLCFCKLTFQNCSWKDMHWMLTKYMWLNQLPELWEHYLRSVQREAGVRLPKNVYNWQKWSTNQCGAAWTPYASLSKSQSTY